MPDIGYPKYQYNIPYDRNWYIIITSKNYHFYFNKLAKESYWQLYDVFNEFTEIDQDEFIGSINFDFVSLLVARNNGLKGLDDYYFKKENKVNEKVAGKEVASVEKEENGRKHEDDISKENEEIESEKYEIDQTARDAFISNLLREEGYLKEKETEKPKKAVEGRQQPVSGLISGYSSSEEEEENGEGEEMRENEGEESIKTEVRVVEIHQAENRNHDETHEGSNEVRELSESDNENINEGLDLTISDEEVDNEGLDLSISDIEEKDSERSEFINLLNTFKDKISIFDSWDLVEEELVEEFIKHPEFYSISDVKEKESIFNEWCKEQVEEQEESNDDIYPTPTLSYFKFLQNYKKEIKKLYYKEFYNKFMKGVDDIQLSPKEKENLFRLFKITIVDFSNYEKQTKKSKDYDPNINLKKFKLDNYLVENLNEFRSLCRHSQFLEEIENLNDIDSFTKWLKLINKFNIPKKIVESPNNFIVGDDKRFQSYLEVVKKVNRE